MHPPSEAHLLALLPLLAACGPPPRPTSPPDILVVVVDTLRQDHVGAYGYPRNTTPVLDALATEGTLYREARSTSSWTAPAHASLFTGLYPAAHGTTQQAWDLALDHDTLAEVLASSGYETLGAVANPMLSSERGYAQGFGDWQEGWSDASFPSTTDDRRLVDGLVERLRAPAPATRPPRFVFVNLVGVHAPYTSCGRWCGAFGAQPGEGIDDADWKGFYLGRVQHDAAAFARLTDLYDAEVLAADELVGRLVRSFREAAAARDHLVVVTSDHGENLGDHGHVDHVFTLYESTVRVPLVVAGTAVPAGRVQTTPVQLHDLFPTVLQAAGVDPAAHPSQGLPLAAVPADRAVLLQYDHPVQATRMMLEGATPEEATRVQPYLRALNGRVEGADKLILGSDGAAELFDLVVDRDETFDLAMESATRVQAMTDQLDAHLRAVTRTRAPHETAPVDAVTQEALEAIGYTE